MDDRIRLVGAALWSEEEGAIRDALVETECFPWNGVWRGEALLCAVALFVRLARKRGWPRGDARAVMEWAMRNWRDGGPAALSAERKKRDRVQGRCKAPGSEIVGSVASELRERSRPFLEPPNPFGAGWFAGQMDTLAGMARRAAR
jgi:hypothetical protein